MTFKAMKKIVNGIALSLSLAGVANATERLNRLYNASRKRFAALNALVAQPWHVSHSLAAGRG